MLLARLMSGYGRDASLNAKERRAPGTASITQLPGSPSASRSSNFGSEAIDGEREREGRGGAAPVCSCTAWLGLAAAAAGALYSLSSILQPDMHGSGVSFGLCCRRGPAGCAVYACQPNSTHPECAAPWLHLRTTHTKLTCVLCSCR